ncbi:hypothetical protein TB1_025439 [Malus domestica]
MTAHEASSSSSSKSKLWNYDVFLSFRGEDTRKGFTDHLHAALKDRGYQTFMGDNDLKRGKEMKEERLLAIEESRNSIIVFSKRYAHSSWCVDELVKIMECRSKLGRHVLPIFYHFDPSHFRKLEEDLAKAFQKRELDIGEEKMTGNVNMKEKGLSIGERLLKKLQVCPATKLKSMTMGNHSPAFQDLSCTTLTNMPD